MDNNAKSEFLEKGLQKLMGKVIDMGRMSEMSERAFKQFERSTKIEFNNLIRILKEQVLGIATEENYIHTEEENK
jgi:hypothetical protein